jgi:hypothetical protein
MTTETNRREFEEWARTNTSIGLDLDMDVDDGVEHYWNHPTYAAWEAWQAAREREDMDWKAEAESVTEERNAYRRERDEARKEAHRWQEYWMNDTPLDKIGNTLMPWMKEWMTIKNPPTSEKI